MRGDSGQSVSVWNAPERVFPVLNKDSQADVSVVGAGITGITCAYLLTRQGKSVVLLDDGPIAGGETCRTTAHLTNAVDDRFSEIERLHGPEGARIAAESHTRAIDTIERIVREERIDCDFSRLDGYLFNPPGKNPKLLETELDAARRAGLHAVDLVARVPWEGFDTGPALRFARQAQFNPLKYLNALVDRLVKSGTRIHRGHVNEVKGGCPATVKTSEGITVRSGAVIVAANSPFNDWVVMHTKQMAYRTYVIAARVPAGSIRKALYWDNADPYHYVRLQNIPEPSSDEMLIVGGEDHRTGQEHDAAARWMRLEQWARERFPQLKEVEYRWSGQVMEPVDGVAFIGPNPGDSENVYIATGDSGQGMTHGTIAGMVLTDLICGRENEWLKLYHPDRKTLRALGEYLGENFNTALQYGDWLTRGEVSSLAQIPAGSGAVLREGIHKIAVYRDESGDCHSFSAKCPHLGGVLHWNEAERTWDCPCHGSRFSAYGKVVNGPAMGDLNPFKLEMEQRREGHEGKKPTHRRGDAGTRRAGRNHRIEGRH